MAEAVLQFFICQTPWYVPKNGRPRGVSNESTVTIDFVIHFSPEYWKYYWRQVLGFIARKHSRMVTKAVEL